MSPAIAHVAYLVRDYDESIVFFTQTLCFNLVEDTDLGGGKRWVLVAPPGARDCCLLLAKAVTPAQQQCIGAQTGGRVFLFLHTDDFWEEYHDMQARGVAFVETPRQETYGAVVVFEDLYGNRWDLLESRT